MSIPKKRNKEESHSEELASMASEIMDESDTVVENPLPEIPQKDNPEEEEGEDMVFCTLSQDHSCSIGGKSWIFKAGERVKVPFNVKCILSRANLLRG